MPPPPMANVQLRAKINKKLNRPTSAWKTLSLGRKSKEDPKQIFRSPSIYENSQENQTEEKKEEGKQESVMKSYLSGKLVPLTPSQQPTNVSHLAPPSDVKAKPTTEIALANANPIAGYCSVM